ncbi:DUF732 domain-containing protein, partial [Mycobacterium nebraskense]
NRCTGDTLFDTDVVLLPSDLPVFEGTYVRILLHRGRDTTDPADADAEFLAALSSQGITYASPEVMIAAGHAVCTELDRGETPAQVAHDVMNHKDVLTGSNLAAHHAGFLVGASIAAYCPTYLGRT